MFIDLPMMARHLTERGVLIIEPWDFPEEPHDEKPWIHTVESDDRCLALAETTTLDGPLCRPSATGDGYPP